MIWFLPWVGALVVSVATVNPLAIIIVAMFHIFLGPTVRGLEDQVREAPGQEPYEFGGGCLDRLVTLATWVVFLVGALFVAALMVLAMRGEL